MPKLTLEDLKKIKDSYKATEAIREGKSRVKINVHMGTCGIAAGARKIMDTVMSEIETNKTTDVLVTSSGCAGLCSKEPMATIEVAGSSPVKYAQLTADKMKKIFAEHVINGKIVEEYALVIGNESTF